MKLGIFGGTFNPIHYGHLRAAQEVQDFFAFDKVLFIPAGRPSFRKPELISARYRYEMTKIAIEKNPCFEISDFEIRANSISYSVETVEHLTTVYKNAELFFIIGIDAFLDLPKWKQPDRLLQLANVIIISRPPTLFVELLSLPFFKSVQKETLNEMDRGIKASCSFPLNIGGKAFLYRISGLEISASRIRSLIQEGKSIKYLLPESVEFYIISHKLYNHTGNREE
jgi:nicotinate-nucleotide adenylyltransferase